MGDFVCVQIALSRVFITFLLIYYCPTSPKFIPQCIFTTETNHNSKVVQLCSVKRSFRTSVSLSWSHRRCVSSLAAGKHALSLGWETLRRLQSPSHTCHSHSVIKKKEFNSSSSSYSPKLFCSSVTTSPTQEPRASCAWRLIGSGTWSCRHNTGPRRTLAGPSQTGPIHEEAEKTGCEVMGGHYVRACARACCQEKPPELRANPTWATSSRSSSSGAPAAGWSPRELLSLTTAPSSGWWS